MVAFAELLRNNMLIKQSKVSQNFVKDDGSSHWYQLNADGTVEARHDATLREARKQLLFPSPTSIEKEVRANQMLARWLKNELAKSFINNPRFPEESDQSYAERVLKISDAKRDEAAIRGTAIHKAIEDGLCIDPTIAPFFEKYKLWDEEHIDTTLHSEMKIADPRIGVAGTVDRVVIHRQHGLVIMDYKTQKVRDGKAAFYESFPRQLSFYAGAYAHKFGSTPRILSVVLDSQTPSTPQEKLYTPQEQHKAYHEFLCGAWLWFSSKGQEGYWPVGHWQPVFNL